MARALLGYVDTVGADRRLLQMEVARLRRRVAELESDLSEARLALLAADGHERLADDLSADMVEAATPALA